ncbi:hypothetical protein BDV96DRAFT_580739 [Lophiotrema nucula]|uniref:Uncharacterized protein n=1 Tax=Lophiotrema nucula TaxID=690887 RepID=A0A6A5YZ35_9PLEO|nr:hypothetical protein BDV96DRAFT_580739 [Lophiotrema nucula]
MLRAMCSASLLAHGPHNQCVRWWWIARHFLPSCLYHCCRALALNEERKKFKPELWLEKRARPVSTRNALKMVAASKHGL